MEESQKKQAQVAALRLLAASPKSRKEIGKKLLDKGYPEAVIQETLASLEHQGVLSDRNFAQNLVGRLLHDKPSGMRKISFELKRRGVSPKIQEDILSGISREEEYARNT